MLHSYVANWLHIIWSTKDRERIIGKEKAIKIRSHLLEHAIEIECPIETINIQPEHLHILLNLPSSINLDDILKKLKGESSHWINSEKLFRGHFHWQKGYGAFSVSASQIDTVKKYIKNQAEHHRKKTFVEEYDTILKKYGFEEFIT
jgi:REP element-mobilizing transposase RayT